MGVIYNSFKQEPVEPTHITAWGKIGGITSWESTHTISANNNGFDPDLSPVSYTHLTLPTNREV